MVKSVIVLGASGNVGPHVITELLRQRSKFNRVAILSDPAKVDKFADAKLKGVEIVIGSFLDSSSFKGFDIVVCLLAVSAGVSHFHPSEFGVDIGKPYFANKRYFEVKFLGRNHLADVAAKNSDFGYTLFMIGMITEFVIVTPLFGVDREKEAVDFVGTEDSKISFTSYPDVARFLVASFLTASPRARELRVQGETLAAGKLFETLSTVQNVSYETSYTSLEKAKEIQARLEQDGNEYGAGFMNLKQAIGARGWLDGNDAGQFDTKPETVEETFKRLSS